MLNFYLDNALQSNPILKKKIEDNTLLAYANHVVISFKSKNEIKIIIRDL